ncbi:hypothetical protein CTAYLR_010653 [Chrysophaeum taylorii]|uniref:W2 domain-containing protein n=1 Tax=Chrysophaeum taylorii TaxID=2483200 RepID=A0AAD7UHR0_9STRA|nr:hypothetical protein CTAYLR_010653 [Chrysophaeum taylorii]
MPQKFKGTKVNLNEIVGSTKPNIPDRPMERAEGDQGFFKRDYPRSRDRDGDRGFGGRDGDRGYGGRDGDRGYGGRDGDRGYGGRDGDRGYGSRDGDRGYGSRDGGGDWRGGRDREYPPRDREYPPRDRDRDRDRDYPPRDRDYPPHEEERPQRVRLQLQPKKKGVEAAEPPSTKASPFGAARPFPELKTTLVRDQQKVESSKVDESAAAARKAAARKAAAEMARKAREEREMEEERTAREAQAERQEREAKERAAEAAAEREASKYEGVVKAIVDAPERGAELVEVLATLSEPPPIERLTKGLLEAHGAPALKKDAHGLALKAIAGDDATKQMMVVLAVQAHFQTLGFPKDDVKGVPAVMLAMKALFLDEIVDETGFQKWRDDEDYDHIPGKMDTLVQCTDFIRFLDSLDEDADDADADDDDEDED